MNSPKRSSKMSFNPSHAKKRASLFNPDLESNDFDGKNLWKDQWACRPQVIIGKTHLPEDLASPDLFNAKLVSCC